MRYTITFREDDYNHLMEYLFIDREIERGAYALCRISESEYETRLLVREIIQVLPEDIVHSSQIDILINNNSFVKVFKKADDSKQVFVFIHSHPNGFLNHSKKDDIEEAKLFRTAYNRIKTKGVHGSIVFSHPDKPVGRVWLENGKYEPISLTRVIGKKFRFYTDLNSANPLPVFFDRQIRAFGEEVQKLFSVLRIGIVGAGGTGSAVIEQLTRLGVKSLLIIDGETFEKTNVNRVYGSKVTDEGKDKVVIAKENSKGIGLDTTIEVYNKPITYISAARMLKDCDIIFGCTDDNWGRSILTRLAVYYGIPVFDMGVRINSKDGNIKSIQGRVTTLIGNYACLFCRDRIRSEEIQSESLAATNPEKLKELKNEGYAVELPTTTPSVIPFTTSIASAAISEFLHRITGYMGEDRITNEIILNFDDSLIRRNSKSSNEECFCGDNVYVLRGDANPFLDLTWLQE